MWNRTRKIGAIAGIAGGALLLVGTGAATAMTNLAPAPQSGAQNVSVQQGGTNPDIGTSNCEASDFSVSMTPKPDESVPTFVMEIGNQSGKNCTINNGFPGVTGVNMANEPVDLPVENVDTPNPPPRLTLKPGDSAYAAVGVEVGDKEDPNSFVISGFRTNLPDMPEQLDAQLPPGFNLELPAKGLYVSQMLSDPSDIR